MRREPTFTRSVPASVQPCLDDDNYVDFPCRTATRPRRQVAGWVRSGPSMPPGGQVRQRGFVITELGSMHVVKQELLKRGVTLIPATYPAALAALKELGA